MKIYVIDRIEEGIATVVCDEGGALNLPANTLLGMGERDVFSAREVDGELFDITPMPKETQRRMQEARNLLDKLKRKKQI